VRNGRCWRQEGVGCRLGRHGVAGSLLANMDAQRQTKFAFDSELPPFLYKYRLPCWGGWKQVLDDESLFFPSASMLASVNDAADCRPEVQSPTSEDVSASVSRRMSRWTGPLGHRWYIEYLLEQHALDDQGTAAGLYSAFETQGVLSLSEDPCSDEMWSRYGGEHQGAAIQLSTGALQEPEYRATMYSGDIGLTCPWVPVKVRYTGARPKYNVGRAVEDGKWLEDYLCTKRAEFAFEQEWRYFTDLSSAESGGTPRRVPPGGISGLVFGLRPDKALLELVQRFMEHRAEPLLIFGVTVDGEDERGDSATRAGNRQPLVLRECTLDELRRRSR
jgi:DUF2971 family protein